MGKFSFFAVMKNYLIRSPLREKWFLQTEMRQSIMVRKELWQERVSQTGCMRTLEAVADAYWSSPFFLFCIQSTP